MTELEKMQRAKMYMDKLANGIDPISDRELPEDSALNQVRLSRCFFYVADVFRQVIENGGVVSATKRPKRERFSLPAELVSRVQLSEQPLRISDLVARINEHVDPGTMRRLSPASITNWLLEKGFLAAQKSAEGKSIRLPTEQGRYIGLSTEIRSGQYGEYQTVLYNQEAQRFVLDNLDTILKECR